MINIIIPTHKYHFDEIERFLNSNQKYNLDAKLTKIYLVIFTEELNLFSPLCTKFDNINILLFKNLILKYFNITLSSETEFLNSKGATAVQSLKKLLGMLECEGENIFLTDSETYFIRECSLIKECNTTKSILYSYKLGNDVQHLALNVAKKILNNYDHLPWIGLVFSYQWIFNKKDVVLFFNKYYKDIISNVLILNYNIFFIEIILYLYLYTSQNTNYKFIDVTEILKDYPDCEHFWLFANNIDHDSRTISALSSQHNIFCYSVQNINNIDYNYQLIKNNLTFRILTSTPYYFNINN